MTGLQNQSGFESASDRDSSLLWEDGELVFRRGFRRCENGERRAVLIVAPAEAPPSRATLERLAHEHELKDRLDGAWAVRPLELVRDGPRTALVLEDVRGEPLVRLLDGPMELRRFLEVAVAIAAAVGNVHQAGLVHKDIKPANILLDEVTDAVRLTGFGVASRFERERQSPQPPGTIVGSLAYMAPEQTGRMNRSIDSRSDLYALGITFYQMLTGALPFAARDPMEWVHCHVARQPVAPADRMQGIPSPISAIVMKLLAKRAEDRYQTAAGLERDLRHCRREWETERRIDDFPLGRHDIRDRLLIPEKLYGRGHDVETLLASFDRVVSGGAPELVLVSGYSGIGKSSLVGELQPVLVPPRGLFAAGKFDQYERDVPYSTLAQAFRSLVRPLLGKSEPELEPWRDALRESLGPNVGLIADLVPDVKLILGEPPPVPEVPPQDAQRRFQLACRQFIGVFARAEHPLALFLDDLQWLDPATLALLDDLLSQSDLRHLLLIGAYRDNEVTDAHPLVRTLEAFRSSGRVHDIELRPLTAEDLARMVADALGSAVEQTARLAELVYGKTGGNPFFVIQFLRVLAEERLLEFDHEHGRWSWSVDAIGEKHYTDNVVELLARKLTRLSPETRDALRQLACLGNAAEVRMLALVLGKNEAGLHGTLLEARQQQLIELRAGSYRFVHDKVQEAAYALTPETARAATHLAIGRVLVTYTPPEKRDETIFEIVNQFNRGQALIDSNDEREQVAELNLLAGRRAKASTAYVSALHYLVTGAALLANDGWERRPDLVFAFELHRAECEFLTGDYDAADARLTKLGLGATALVDRSTVARLHSEVHTTLDRSDRALSVCLDYLRHAGIEWSPRPTEEEAQREYERTWILLGQREIEELIDLPLMSDPQAEATMEVLTQAFTPALFTDANLLTLVLWKMVNLSLEFGNCEASCQAYAHIGAVRGTWRFWMTNYQAAFRFGRLGYDLAERHGFKRFQARTTLAYGHGVVSATSGPRAARDLIRRVFDIANAAGDLTYAAFSWHHLVTNLLLAGDPLADAQEEAERGLKFAKRAHFGLEMDIMRTHLAHILSLRGLTPTFGCMNGVEFDEAEIERRLSSDPRLTYAEFRYWWQKLQTRFFAGDYASAIEASRNRQRFPTYPTAFETAEANFYGALSHAACCEPASSHASSEHRQELSKHHGQLLVWSRSCPATMETRVALVESEIARVEGRELEAERRYEAAIQSARKNELVQLEAMGNELAARFYAARGFETIANAYLREARSCYRRWGADGKVRQLETLHPFLRERESARSADATVTVPSEQLDLATVVQVSQAVSSEMQLEKLIDTLVRLGVEHAGAGRGLLLLSHGLELRQEAEAITSGDGTVVHRRGGSKNAHPPSIVNYVMRSRDVVILDDASTHPTYSSDPYVRACNAKSILCLPLVNDAKVTGVLYLENNLTPNAFTPDRVTVLKVLAAQAAVSLDNSRLYHALANREGKIQRLVDANILGICIWNLEGAVVEANEAFLSMLQYRRDDVAAGRLRWTELTPGEWRERDEVAVVELRATGSFQPFEKEFVRRDGSRVPVLIGGALFEESADEGVAFVLDLSERKRAERAVRESEARFRDYAETSSDWFWEIGPDYKFTLLTEQAFGSDAARRIGTACWEHALDYETEPEKWGLMRSALDSRKPFRDFIYRSTDGRGSPIYVRASGKPRFDSNGVFRGYRGTSTDVTAIVRSEEALNVARAELAHAARLMTLGALTASIAHEVNQPLSGIITNSSTCLRMLNADPPNVDGARATAQRTLRDGNRASEIIHRLRAMFARKERTIERFDLNEAARELLALTSTELRLRGVALQTDLQADLPAIAGDRVQLQQVILNLVLNAADAMKTIDDHPRVLLVATTRDADGIRLSVRDSGIGIDSEHAEELFEAFYTTKTSGMGVGLSISRSIVENHDGRIWATNNEGPGATFAFTIPVAQP